MKRTPNMPSPLMLGTVFFVGVLAVSSAAIFVRMANSAAGGSSPGLSLVFATTRLAFASLFLIPVWRKVVVVRVKPQVYVFAVLAGVFLGIHFAGYVASLGYTSIAASATLVNTNPVWLALLAWLWLGKRPSRLSVLGIVLAVSGGVLIALSGASGAQPGANPLLGNLLALMGAFGFTFYLLLGSEAQRRGLAITPYIVIAYSVGALSLAVFPPLFGTSYFDVPLAFYGFALVTALLPQLVGHTAFNWTSRFLSPTLVSLVILFEPLVASLLGYLIFSEVPGRLTFIGAPVLLMGVAAAILGERQSVNQR